MLGRDLLRVRVEGGRAVPQWLKPTPALRQLADAVLNHYSAANGRSRADIDDGLAPIIHGSRSQIVARGLIKLVEDACTFSDADSCQDLREQIFDRSAAAIRQPGAPRVEVQRAAILTALGQPPELELYSDLPHRARLTSAPTWSMQGLLDEYNLALAQGLLLGAHSLQVTLGDRDPGLRRRLIKALRFHRLLADIHQTGDHLVFEVAGPGSVLDQRTRYGLQLACFLPHLVTAGQWQARAEIHLPRDGGSAWLELDQHAPLVAHSRFLAYTPPELQHLAERLGQRKQPFAVTDQAPLISLDNGEIVAPDLSIRGRHQWALECFHRWHDDALIRRCQQLASGQAPGLLIAVDKDLIKREAIAAAVADQRISARIMTFNGFPSATALARLVTDLESASD